MKTVSRTTAIKGLALAAIASLALAGCAAAPAAPTATPVNYKACMVSDAGGFNDASFNQEAYAGLQQAKACLLYTSDAADEEECRSRWSPYH